MLARMLGGLIVAWLAGAPFQATGDKVDDYVRQQMKQRGMPGLSLAIVHHGKVVKALWPGGRGGVSDSRSYVNLGPR